MTTQLLSYDAIDLALSQVGLYMIVVAQFEAIPSSLPPPWWLLAAMMVIFALVVRRIFKIQDNNNEVFQKSMNRLIDHFTELSKRASRQFERTLKSVLETHKDGLEGVELRLGELSASVGGLTQAIDTHTGTLDVLSQRMGHEQQH